VQTIPWIVKGRATRLLNTDGRSSSSVVSGAQASEIFSYDELGRVKINSQCTPQNCGVPAVFPINYTYDLLGDTLTATNGEGVTLTYGAYNRALRITGMTSSLSNSNYPGTLYSSPHYNAAGSVTSAYIGNPGSGVSETRGYDGRLRVDSIADGSIYTVTIPTNGGYAPDSDILLANDSVNGNWTYGYDAFNRLASANATGQAYTYAYDRFGNRWQQNGPHSSQPGFDANNHMVPGLGVTYDAAGNETNDGTTAYTYDSENRLITATNSASGASSYFYDAEGRRVRKASAATGTRDYLYDLSGHETTQVMSTGVWARGEVYVGGRHLATYVNATTYFNFSDWLGTERARALTGTSTACETMTSLPFGDGQTTAGSCGDPSFVHFTGKERDSESGLDNFGARYNSSQYGRFMSPDPLAGHTEDPQTLNRYSYVRNNPLNLTDPTGLDFHLRCGDDSDTCQNHQVGSYATNNDGSRGAFNSTVVTSDSIRNGTNSATVDQNGVQVTTGGQTYQGQYFDNAASHTTDANGNDVNHNPIDLAGSGSLRDFSFNINGNCSGTCLSSGSWSYNGSPNAARSLLGERGAFTIPFEDAVAGFGGGAHPFSTQHRFGGAGCSFWGCPNSPHLSVPYDPNGTLEPRNNVPATGGFHVDAHGDWFGHYSDVTNAKPQ